MKFFYAVLLLLIPYFSKAQDSLGILQTATVTATNSYQKAVQTGRNIIIINPAQYENLAVNSIDELLRYAAGIEVQQRGPQGAQSDLLIRGGTFQQVLVLIDGIRLNDPLTGHFNGNIPIHPSEIERIEILKGAASAVWGADAVGGVVHIITKAFVKRQFPKSSVNTGIQVGELGLVNFNANASMQIKQSYFSLGILSNNAAGNQLRGTTGFFNLHTINGSFRQQLQKGWQLSIKSILDYRNFNAQNFYTTFKSDTAKERVNTFFNHLQLSKKMEKSALVADVSYKALSDEFQFNTIGIANTNNSKQLIGQVNYNTKASTTTEVVVGSQIMNRSIKSNDRGNHSLWNIGTWLILKHQLAKSLFINEGVRLDYSQRIGLIATPQINIAYNPSAWSLRASFAQGIRDADFTERYNNYNRPLVTSGSIGNPDLKPEKTYNLEIGTDYVASSKLKISTTLFYRNQNQLIDYAPTAYNDMPRTINLVPAGSYALATNLANVKTKGAEIDLNYTEKINEHSSFTINYNLTYLNSKNKDSIPSFYISAHANWLSNYNMVYSFRRFTAAINGLYKARNAQAASAINASLSKSYFLLNTKIAYGFQKAHCTLFAQAHNLLNTTYSDLLGAIMPERWVSGGLQVKF